MSIRPSSLGGLAFVNADLDGSSTTVRIERARIASIGDPPRAGDRIIDLQGDRILPGLINAHDHLQLNSLPRQETDGKHYRNVRDWIAESDAERRADGGLKPGVSIPTDERLLIGGVKNLLSGVTTVAHHDPLFPSLWHRAYPLHVLTCCGWSHSLYIDGDDKVRESYKRTPPEWPWIIHAAEGVDAEAIGEFERLVALGCIGANTLLVHGVALEEKQRTQLVESGAALIWCPASNLYLFGTTVDPTELIRRGQVALGTDSRLSGSRDLLEEIRVAVELAGLKPNVVESLVTREAARLLRLADRGVLEPGARADILILPNGMPLSKATRADIRLVMVDGIGRYADEEYAHAASVGASWTDVRVDGRPKLLERKLATRLSQARTTEAGLELMSLTWRAA